MSAGQDAFAASRQKAGFIVCTPNPPTTRSSAPQRRVVVILLVGFGGVLAPFAEAQTGAYEWRQTPQPLPRSGTVSPDIGSARDKFFDRLYGPLPKGVFSNGLDPGPIFEEIPTDKSLTVALVQFVDYTTIRSASRKSIYTEVRMKVEQVFRDPSETIRPATALTVILGGGSLRLPSGKIVREYLDQGIESGIQPGHRYLAFLYHEKDGDYFYCAKSWDLSSGAAVPTYGLDIQVAKRGTSHFAGMPEDKFIAAVRIVLSSGAK